MKTSAVQCGHFCLCSVVVQCGQDGCPMWTFYGQGKFFRCRRPLFLMQKTSDFSKYMVCPHGQERVQFSAILYWRPLWTAPYLKACKQQLQLKVCFVLALSSFTHAKVLFPYIEILFPYILLRCAMCSLPMNCNIA